MVEDGSGAQDGLPRPAGERRPPAEPASAGLPVGSARRRLGNFRTPELASRVQEVLSDAGIPSSRERDRHRPERWGRFLDWLVHMTGASGNRLWVPRERFRDAAQALRDARRQGR